MFYAIFDIITIGIPFCAFKIAAGVFYEQYWLLWLGAIDLVINSINFFLILIKRKKVFDTCLLAFIFRKILSKRWQDLGEAIDVALSFSIVALVIGSGDIAGFQHSFIVMWNWAVVFNVLGAGSARVFQSLREVKNST